MLKRVLIANRGEIALRIIRACRELDVETVAVWSQADESALHAQIATRALCIGPAKAADSYLKQDAILSAALATGCDTLRNRLNESTAETQILRLRIAEFERLRTEDAARIRALGLRLRHVEATAKAVAATDLDKRVPLHDTLVVRLRDTLVLRDTVRLFRWQDAWVTLEGEIGPDSVHCRVESVDTLHQIVYRIPRRFLFIRWGTKALRQQIASTNPHTHIVASEYVRIER